MAQSPAVQSSQEILQPGEMTPRHISELAREHTELAVRTLVEVASSRQAPDNARVMAATALGDRGWGKSPQAVLIAEQRPQVDWTDPHIRRNLARKIAFFFGGEMPK